MKSIVTLTLNGSIDVSSEADHVRHTRKMRTFHERYDPGGGGINVARAVNRLGGRAHAVCLAGGITGPVLDGLLAQHGVDRTIVPIADSNRTSLAVYERSSGLEYRFVPEGPVVRDDEWQSCLESIQGLAGGFFVASGSLPRGVPDDFYARVRAALSGETRFVLDTSGAALREALAAGGVFLVKPSRGELEQLVGRPLPTPAALLDAAAGIVARGEAENVAVTLGRDGALLMTGKGAARLAAVPVEARSAVGAGDSFVAGMTHGLARGLGPAEAFRLGVAAGTAAVLTPGNDLCHHEDVDRILATLPPLREDDLSWDLRLDLQRPSAPID